MPSIICALIRTRVRQAGERYTATDATQGNVMAYIHAYSRDIHTVQRHTEYVGQVTSRTAIFFLSSVPLPRSSISR